MYRSFSFGIPGRDRGGSPAALGRPPTGRRRTTRSGCPSRPGRRSARSRAAPRAARASGLSLPGRRRTSPRGRRSRCRDGSSPRHVPRLSRPRGFRARRACTCGKRCRGRSPRSHHRRASSGSTGSTALRESSVRRVADRRPRAGVPRGARPSRPGASGRGAELEQVVTVVVAELLDPDRVRRLVGEAVEEPDAGFLAHRGARSASATKSPLPRCANRSRRRPSVRRSRLELVRTGHGSTPTSRRPHRSRRTRRTRTQSARRARTRTCARAGRR